MKVYRSVEQRIHTDRQHLNRHYANRAMEILGLTPGPKWRGRIPPATWLVDWAGETYGKLGAIKWGVLEQLGRMSYAGFTDEAVRDAAAKIEKLRLTVKDAARVLRHYRLSA